MKNSPRHLLAALTLVLLATACGTPTKNPVTGKTERTVMDEKTEIAEGRKAHEEVLKEYSRLDNPALQAYVSELGQRLAAQSHRPHLPWTFTVLDSPEVNAFALPGGYVYVTRGIMAFLDSEADLAGVLGHEIGHVTARHGAQRATRQQNAGLGVFAATVLGVLLESRGAAGAGQAAGQIAQGVAAGHIAKYGREQELQADQLGAEYLARVQYDPGNMVDVIGVLLDQDKYREDQARAAGKQPAERNDWLASHPTSEERLQKIRARALAVRQGDRYQDEGRLRYLQAMDGVTVGDSREQGVIRGRHFFHEPLQIALTAPQGWRINNTGEAVQVVNPAGDAGLIMRLVPAEAGSTHEEIVRNLFKPEKGRLEPLALQGGLKGSHFSGVRRNSEGQAVNVEASFVTGPANRHYLLGWAAADAQALQRARPGLREAEASFRALGAAEARQARPHVLRLVPMPAGGFAQLARSSPLTEQAENRLRLLNGAYGRDEPKAGQLVKVVGLAP
jgi:predicted Zn-dependent protease